MGDYSGSDMCVSISVLFLYSLLTNLPRKIVVTGGFMKETCTKVCLFYGRLSASVFIFCLVISVCTLGLKPTTPNHMFFRLSHPGALD